MSYLCICMGFCMGLLSMRHMFWFVVVLFLRLGSWLFVWLLVGFCGVFLCASVILLVGLCGIRLRIRLLLFCIRTWYLLVLWSCRFVNRFIRGTTAPPRYRSYKKNFLSACFLGGCGFLGVAERFGYSFESFVGSCFFEVVGSHFFSFFGGGSTPYSYF